MQLTSRRQFSMVYTLIDHGEWFHCQVLNILWRHFIVYKSIDHRKLPFVFYNNKDKLRAELALLSDEKVRTLHLTSFLLSVPL